ncbi:MAG TPA: response regulator transcription factor [Candidatus Acidoferrum sp.]|nr:response regulator transcription factor [Candidatus Acidoferrum sp.]
MRKLRILLADDHALIRRGARALLQGRPGWKVVGEAADGTEALEKAKQLKPDVAIVDISMPELDGVQATRQIREAVPNTKVLVLTIHESHQMVQNALDAGAHGYVLKSDLTESLVEAVKNVAAGKRSLTPKVSEIVLEGFLKARGRGQATRADAQPTPREMQILRLLAEGKVNKEIAYQLGIAVRTVEAHRAHVMQKLGLRSLADLVHYALRHGIASAPKDPPSP